MLNSFTVVGHPSERDYALAESACRTATALEPKDAEAFLLLGQVIDGEIYSGSRSDNAAIEAIENAIKLRPAWPDAYCELGRALVF